MKEFYPNFFQVYYLCRLKKAKRCANKLSLAIALFFSGHLFSQSNHTVTFTNSSSDFNALEKISASAGGTTYYITFDQNNLYIGAFNLVGLAATDNLAIYIDTDPQLVTTTGKGSITGKLYNGVTPTLPFRADYNVYEEQLIQQANIYSGSWVAASGPVYSASVNAREVSIPFSAMANPKALNLTLWIGNTGSIYSNAPGANIASSATPVIAGFFGTFGIMNGAQGNVNPVNVITSPATGYLSASGTLTGGTYAYIDVTGNTTITGLTLAPGGVINVNAGQVLTSSGTINNTALVNNTNSTQIAVSGTYTLNGRAYCSYFNVNNGATYNHNSAGSVANGVSTDWPGMDTRTYGPASNVNINQWAQTNAALPVGIPAPTSGSWGNVTINVSQSYGGNWHQKGAFDRVSGNLVLNNLGFKSATTQFFSFYQQLPADTINIGGNFVMSTSSSNGIILCQNDNPGLTGASTHVMNVHGDFIVTGGHIKFGYHYANAVINYWGNYSQTGGEIQTGTNVGIKDTINAFGVNKTISATASIGTSFDTDDFIWIITKNAQIDLASDLYFFGNSISDPTNCQIIVDGTLDCAQYALKDWASGFFGSYYGNAVFTLSPFGTLESGTSSGITVPPDYSGSIQTKFRSYSSQANYVYNGKTSQVTGSGLPSTVGSLTINNSSNSNTVSLSNDVTITSFHEIDKGVLSLGSKNVTLHSDRDTTASFHIMGPGSGISYGTGRYIVERYINTGTGAGEHGKSWQLLSTPADGGTVYSTWQESGNTPAGYGTWITDPSGTANGFDAYSVSPSIKTYNPAINDWEGISSANNLIANQFGYLLFVRGDRNARTVNATPTPTTLRITGKLFTGNLPAINVSAGLFQSIGNPYASAVTFPTLFSNATNIDNLFYAWDPALSGTFGYGGYQTISAITGYIAIPGGSTIYNSTTGYSNIQSGQAIFVHNSSAWPGAVNFTENCKDTGSILVNRISGPVSPSPFFFANLYTSNGILADGNAVAFGNSFSNKINKNDAVKLMNAGENFGIKKESEILSIDARLPVRQADTIFYDMHNLGQQSYRLLFVPKNIYFGLSAVLIDQYLKTEKTVSVSDSTYFNFSVTSDPASSAANRFMIVFRPSAGAVAVSYISVNAYKQSANILVEWNVENENDMQKYEVEHSTDGNDFSVIAKIGALNISNNKYSIRDDSPAAGYNYFRIIGLDKNGKITYSQVSKVFFGNIKSQFSVYPNPVQDEKINLQFIDQPAGKYLLRLTNSSGQTLMTGEMNHSGNGSQSIRISNGIPHGVYQLEILRPDGGEDVIKVKK